MFYVNVFADGQREKLRFASKRDANAFLAFAKIYVDDSGAGNGYGAYWVYLDEKPSFSPIPLPGSTEELDEKLISQMLSGILAARQASNTPTMIGWSWGKRRGFRGGITFMIDPIPKRQRPAVGDMYRIPRSAMSADYSELPYSEGRVLEDNGDTFTLRSCYNEEPSTGEWRRERVTYTIAADRVMKINDWLSAMRHPDKVRTDNK